MKNQTQSDVAKIVDEKVIALTKEELKTFMDDVNSQTGWSDTSYKICRFIGIDPTQGT